MKPHATPSRDLMRLLHSAIAELRTDADEISMSSRFQRVGDVADYIERLVKRLETGDTDAGRALYSVFCATSDWDDAFGSHELGSQLLLALTPYYSSDPTNVA